MRLIYGSARRATTVNQVEASTLLLGVAQVMNHLPGSVEVSGTKSSRIFLPTAKLPAASVLASRLRNDKTRLSGRVYQQFTTVFAGKPVPLTLWREP